MTKPQFEQIYLDHYAGLFMYGQTLTKNKQTIEDTIQEIFLGFFKNKNDLNQKKSLENYLIICFRNCLIKKLNRFKIIELQTDLPDVPSNQEIDPVENSLIHFIDQLPSHQKEVIYLRYYKDKSFHEIAEILGIKYQVARNFSYRGIKFLRNKILVLRTYKIAKSV